MPVVHGEDTSRCAAVVADPVEVSVPLALDLRAPLVHPPLAQALAVGLAVAVDPAEGRGVDLEALLGRQQLRHRVGAPREAQQNDAPGVDGARRRRGQCAGPSGEAADLDREEVAVAPAPGAVVGDGPPDAPRTEGRGQDEGLGGDVPQALQVELGKASRITDSGEEQHQWVASSNLGRRLGGSRQHQRRLEADRQRAVRRVPRPHLAGAALPEVPRPLTAVATAAAANDGGAASAGRAGEALGRAGAGAVPPLLRLVLPRRAVRRHNRRAE
mmetsp:Transcript_173741/g.556833  ORF Transcript_173741/g.556833 Transcript_173741/m.556833 type:complete len:272 (+) Transcript_173741:833-1648(+)